MKNKVMFLIIYIYGNAKFKKEIKSLLLKSDINKDIVDIDKLNKLKETIKNSPRDIFLIDDAKIIHNKLLNKINFLKAKDSIEKDFLDQYGIGDICFNSMNSFINYILNRIDTNGVNIDDSQIQDSIEEVAKEEIRDVENIICIDDIFDSEMTEAMNEFELNKENQTKE